MAAAGFIGRLVFFTGGLLVWAAHFTFLYGFHALVCARPGTGTVTPGVVAVTIGAATLVAIAVNVAILLMAMRGQGPGISGEEDPAMRQFWRFGTAMVAAFSLVAIVWSGIPVLVIPPCA